MSKMLTTKEFIEKSKSIHGELFDYSESQYLGSKNPIVIICRDHGRFTSTPDSHYRGGGCRQCMLENIGDRSRSTLEDVIRKAKKVHGDKYDYSLVDYKNNKIKVILVCKKHGEFTVSMDHHINSRIGCKACTIENGRAHTRLTTEEFISRSKSIHEERYSYKKSVYVHSSKKVIVTCPYHGDFLVKPISHMNGHGCIKCYGRQLQTKEDFVKKSRKVHGMTFDYKDFIYVNNHTPGKIICRHHGGFWQSPANHKSGQSCPSCQISKGEAMIAGILGRVGLEFISQYKFQGCRHKRRLPFDFFIPQMNACIEYQGQQHFHVARGDFFGGEKALKARQKRDQIKRDYCQKNGIPLLEIRYDDPDPEATLREFLSQYSDRKFIDPQLKLFPV